MLCGTGLLLWSAFVLLPEDLQDFSAPSCGCALGLSPMSSYFLTVIEQALAWHAWDLQMEQKNEEEKKPGIDIPLCPHAFCTCLTYPMWLSGMPTHPPPTCIPNPMPSIPTLRASILSYLFGPGVAVMTVVTSQ